MRLLGGDRVSLDAGGAQQVDEVDHRTDLGLLVALHDALQLAILDQLVGDDLGDGVVVGEDLAVDLQIDRVTQQLLEAIGASEPRR